MNKKTFNLVLIFALLLTSNLLAQSSGKITGTVVDSETGETLIGVNVVIDGTIKGTATDIDGRYTIRNVEAGTYTVVVSYLSFSTQRITGVVVEEGETVTLDIALQPESELLDEIVVTADVVLNNEAGLLRQRQKSIAFSDAISAESISKSGSGDAAGALKKVVGASVVGGKYVYVRGLGDRYSTAHLNGSELPSADPDKNAFQLDLIPSNVIENIVTIKTFTPDKPGNFSGGLVDVTTKDFPESLLFNISTSVGFNTETTFKDGLGSTRSSSELIALSGDERELPTTVEDNLGSIPQRADSFLKFRDDHVAASDTLNRVSNAFNNEMTPRSITIPLNTGLSMSLGNEFQLLNRDFGFILGFSHNRSFSSYESGSDGIYQLIGNLNDDTELTALNDLSDFRTQENVDLGGLASLSFKPNPNNKVSLTWVRTQSGTNEGRALSGYREEIFQGGFDDYNSTVISYTERKLSSFQASGKHVAPSLSNLTFEWSGTFSENELDQPDVRFFEYGVRTADTTYSISTGAYSRPQRFFRNMDESNTNLIADLSLPIRYGQGNTLTLKAGGAYLEGSRTFRERRFAYGQDQADINDFDGNFDDFFSYTGIDEERTEANNVFIYYGNYIFDRTNETNNYDGSKEIKAGYLMTEIPFGKFRFIGGARYETTLLSAESQNIEREDSLRIGKIDREDILPSASLIFSINEQQNFRVAYSNTLARPSYREIAPFSGFDAYGGSSTVGNPELDRTLITNYDARWEYFLGVGELVAISGFYKNLEKPIERVFDTQRVRTRTWQNVEEATVYGVEFEVRKNLGFITPKFEFLSLATNVTFVHSEVNVPDDELFTARLSDPDFDDTRPLYGQSPYIFNMDLSYLNPEIDLTVDLNTNVFGDRLSDVTLGANPDVFERGYVTTDLIISKGFANNFSAKLSLKNLLDPEIKSTSELNGEEYVYQSFNRGRSISLSISYKL